MRNVKANVDRFGIYYFVVYVKSESEGSYTDKTAFSVVNKRADGELLNSADRCKRFKADKRGGVEQA